MSLILRQDPEVCPDSRRASGHHDDDDDDDDDDQNAPHKQHVLNPYWRSLMNVEVGGGGRIKPLLKIFNECRS